MRALALATILVAAGTPGATASGGACFRHVRSDAQRELVRRESGGDPLADNPDSTAYGCGQLLRATRRQFGRMLGIHPDTASAAQQMRMMSAYTDHRYGSDDAALDHHRRRRWY